MPSETEIYEIKQKIIRINDALQQAEHIADRINELDDAFDTSYPSLKEAVDFSEEFIKVTEFFSTKFMKQMPSIRKSLANLVDKITWEKLVLMGMLPIKERKGL